MKTLRLLLPLLAALATLPARAEPEAAPPGIDRAPSIPVVAIDAPPAARMEVVAAPGAAAGVAARLARGLEEERAELEALLGGLDAGPMEIRFAYGREEFAALQPRGGRVPGWAAGVAWPALGLVVVDARAAGRGGDVRAVLRHELAHVALGRLVAGPVPRWFTEGFAQLYAGEWTLSRSATLARATIADALIPVADLERGWPSAPTDVDLAYAQSVSIVSHLAAAGDRRGLQRLVLRLGEGEPFHDALAGALGAPLVVLELDWKAELQGRYGWLPFFTDTNLVLGLGGVVLALGAWRARRRRRARLDAMEDGPDLEPPPEADAAGLPALEPPPETDAAGPALEPPPKADAAGPRPDLPPETGAAPPDPDREEGGSAHGPGRRTSTPNGA